MVWSAPASFEPDAFLIYLATRRSTLDPVAPRVYSEPITHPVPLGAGSLFGRIHSQVSCGFGEMAGKSLSYASLLHRLAQGQRFDRVAGVMGRVVDLAFTPGGGEISGSAAGTDFEVPHLAVQVVWVLAGLHEAVENSLDLVGRDPQRGLADTNRPDLTPLDLVVNGALVQVEMIGEVFDLPVLTFKGLDLHNCFRILARGLPTAELCNSLGKWKIARESKCGAHRQVISARGEVPIDHGGEVDPARGLWVELQPALYAADDKLELTVIDAVDEDRPGV